MRTIKLIGCGGMALAIASILTSCCNVQPWQKAPLADFTMRRDRDPLRNKYLEHVCFSREATAGGRDIGGGGCGCN